VHAARDVASALLDLERLAPRRILVERGLPHDDLERLARQARERLIELAWLDYRDSLSVAKLHECASRSTVS
jgi:hypothetical protein